jgi:hypothetical protein
VFRPGNSECNRQHHKHEQQDRQNDEPVRRLGHGEIDDPQDRPRTEVLKAKLEAFLDLRKGAPPILSLEYFGIKSGVPPGARSSFEEGRHAAGQSSLGAVRASSSIGQVRLQVGCEADLEVGILDFRAALHGVKRQIQTGCFSPCFGTENCVKRSGGTEFGFESYLFVCLVQVTSA